MTRATCQMCGSNEWLDLPSPTDGRSVTTTGRIIDESLSKAQCASCGFGQNLHSPVSGLTEYYEQDYATYYDRPGTTQFHAARYRVLAEWMATVLRGPAPSTILDVGCGQGGAMEAMKAFYPQAHIEGLEPSHYNSQVARQKGFQIHEHRVGTAALPRDHYDLVYCNNVLQHVTDTRQFLASLKELAGPNGVIVITCPDASIPNLELLWADQSFSFLPANLIALSRDIGVPTVSWLASQFSTPLPPAQLLLLSENIQWQERCPGMDVPDLDLKETYRSRCEYLGSFAKIDDHICACIRDCERVFNFGASYWSSLLAAYCPRYWQRVSACLVDQIDNIEPAFLDKKVLEIGSVRPTDADALVFGTTPSTHKALVEKLSSFWRRIISWDDFGIQY